MANWVIQLALIILACHACGRAAERLGQSRVVGEIGAGILLGPSFLGTLIPAFYEALNGAGSSQTLAHMGELGLVFLMFEVGLHIDVSRHKKGKVFRPSVAVAGLGMAFPFLAGLPVAAASLHSVAQSAPALPYVLFCGIALSVSAVPVMARIVTDLDLMRTHAASVSLSAALLTDLAGWIALAVVTSIAAARSSIATFVESLMYLALYVGAIMFIARLLRVFLSSSSERAASSAMKMTLLICFLLLSAWTTSRLGFHSAFGALLPAILLRDIPGLREQWENKVHGFVQFVLTPVFFSYAGMHASFGMMDGATGWMWFCLFFSVGFLGKLGGAYLGARLSGKNHTESAVTGALMNTRGLMELIVLSIGLELKILPEAVYTILLMFALVTTALTVPMIRFIMRADTVRLVRQQ